MTVELHAREIQPLRNTFTHTAYYVGNDRPASRYQEATLDVQPSDNFHYRQLGTLNTRSMTSREPRSSWLIGMCCATRASTITLPGL